MCSEIFTPAAYRRSSWTIDGANASLTRSAWRTGGAAPGSLPSLRAITGRVMSHRCSDDVRARPVCWHCWAARVTCSTKPSQEVLRTRADRTARPEHSCGPRHRPPGRTCGRGLTIDPSLSAQLSARRRDRTPRRDARPHKRSWASLPVVRRSHLAPRVLLRPREGPDGPRLRTRDADQPRSGPGADAQRPQWRTPWPSSPMTQTPTRP